jgi:hypothetical protein
VTIAVADDLGPIRAQFQRLMSRYTRVSLYHDADGSGAGAAVEFAHVGSGLGLSAADFIVS